MTDYEPIDLSPYCNTGPSNLNLGDARRGPQSLRGLPFRFAEDPQRCCIVPSGSPVRIEVGQPARHVIVAHRQLAGPASDIEGVGLVVAEYRFHMQGGTTVSVAIRGRFEIGVVPIDWGLLPFLAVSDQSDELYPRTQGPFSMAGLRQCESTQVYPREYVLWSWDNPRPELVLDAIELVPAGQPFAVGAVTLSHAEEHPFVRTPGRPVVISLDGDAAGVAVEVDRGVATYVQPVPSEDDGAVAGWGRRPGATLTSRSHHSRRPR